MENGIEKIKEGIHEHIEKISLFLLGLVLILIGILCWSFFQPTEKEEAPGLDLHEELLAESRLEQLESLQVEPEAEELEPIEIIVDVKGAIVSPGVYTMMADHRVIDVVEKAGGFTKEAEQNAVNLAKVVEDQMVIYIPKVGEEGWQETDFNQAAAQATGEASNENLVNINHDGKEALMTLNGIGSSKADSIIGYREEHGFFQTIEEIKNVSGIGDATFENLKDQITVSP